MVTKIKQIFKQAVLRFWSLRVPLIVVCILLAALLCTAQYQDSSRVASAQMTLNYSEASQGLNPQPHLVYDYRPDLRRGAAEHPVQRRTGRSDDGGTAAQGHYGGTHRCDQREQLENYITTSCSISRSWKNPAST